MIKWNHELRFIVSFNLFFSAFPGQLQIFPKVPSLVYKLEMCKERMFSALTHSGVWSLFQAVLMTKYAMNLEHLQPWRWQIAFCFTSSVACSSSLLLDLFYTKLLLHSRAAAQVCSFREKCSLSGLSVFKIPACLPLHSKIRIFFIFIFFLLLLRAYVIDKPLKYHLETNSNKKRGLWFLHAFV